jgi:hypothetical protein
MDDMKMRLADEIKAPPGFVDGVMDAIERRNANPPVYRPVYTPAAKGILCIVAAALLLALSIPKLDFAWSALAEFGKVVQVSHENDPAGGDDGLSLPGGPVLYVSNTVR